MAEERANLGRGVATMATCSSRRVSSALWGSRSVAPSFAWQYAAGHGLLGAGARSEWREAPGRLRRDDLKEGAVRPRSGPSSCLITTERRESIAQAFDRLAAERKALLDDIQTRQADLLPIMEDLQQTIAASSDLARELTRTITALDKLVARFDRGENDSSEPLDINDLGRVATEMSKVAEEFTVMLEHAESTVESPDLARRLDGLDGMSTRIVDHMFWRGVLLIVLLVAGLALLRLIPIRTRSTPSK